MRDEQASHPPRVTDKDTFLEIARTGSGEHIALAVNTIAPGTRLSPEKIQEHLIAVDYFDYEPGGRMNIYLYLDTGVYVAIKIESDKETKQITSTEVDFGHLSECRCGE